MTEDAELNAATGSALVVSRLWELLRFFGKLGVFGFGGPMAHLALMEDELVRRRGWVARDYFVDALAVTNLIPGPNSTELSIHLGYERAGLRGAMVSGLAFIGPAFVLMLGLCWAYFQYGNVPQVGWLFYGLKPVVISIILMTVWRTGRSAFADWRLVTLFGSSVGLSYFFPGLEPVVLLTAGAIGIAIYSPPRRWPFFGGLVLLAGGPPLALWSGDVLSDVALVFLKAGGLLFGGGYVMIPLIEHDVVERFGWVTRGEFLDGVALGQATPGPIVITATFVGYAAAGFPGAAVATVAIFAPSFVFATLSARFLRVMRRWQWTQGFLKGVGAAVVGAILAAAIALARAAIVDSLTGAILAASVVAAYRFRVDAFKLLGAGAAIGLLAKAVS